MFTIDKTVVVDKKRNWTPDEKVNGMRFASITRNGSGADLVAMYLESFRYRLKNCEQLSSEIITSNIYDESNTVGSMMKNAISSNLIKNCSIHYCNDILTLKWFMHEYKQCLVELKHTTTTEHPEKFEISSSGLEIDDGMSIGYMMYGYDSEYVILQGVHGIENGFGGFHKMRWDLFNSLFIQGTVFGLKKPLARWRGLKFTAEEAGSTVYMIKIHASAPDVSLMYSLDEGQTWNDFTVCSSSSSLDGTIITLNDVGDEVCFKANGTNQSMASQITSNPTIRFRAYNKFIMSGKISASGNIMSLLDGSNYNSMNSLEGRANAFIGLFLGCESLTTAPKLPVMTLANYCYFQMFRNCTSLTQAPELPATTLAERCYFYMFRGCTSLTTAPELPATTLANNCYYYMFQGCTSLKEIKLEYIGNFSSNYFSDWVNGVSSTGNLYYNGSDTTVGTSAIPSGWNVVKF